MLCGSPVFKDIVLGQEIQSLMKEESINLIGKTSLTQLVAVLKKADIVLSPDSAPAHLATTQGTLVIGLYGHNDPRRTGPYQNLEYVVNIYDEYAEKQYGKPIEALPWSSRVKGKDIMGHIETEQVITQFNRIVKILNPVS